MLKTPDWVGWMQAYLDHVDRQMNRTQRLVYEEWPHYRPTPDNWFRVGNLLATLILFLVEVMPILLWYGFFRDKVKRAEALRQIDIELETPTTIYYFTPQAMVGQWLYQNEPAAWCLYKAHADLQGVQLADPVDRPRREVS